MASSLVVETALFVVVLLEAGMVVFVVVLLEAWIRVLSNWSDTFFNNSWNAFMSSPHLGIFFSRILLSRKPINSELIGLEILPAFRLAVSNQPRFVSCGCYIP